MKKPLKMLMDPIYDEKVKVPKYSGKVSVLSANDSRVAANILINLAPRMSKSEHARIASQYKDLANYLDQQWSKTADSAALRAWGRPFTILDYRVSGIGSNDFSESEKAKLRYFAHTATRAIKAAAAHKAASTSRRI